MTTATAMRGASAGAKPANQACSVRPGPTSAVPVLPAITMLSRWTVSCAVPTGSATTRMSAARRVCQAAGVRVAGEGLAGVLVAGLVVSGVVPKKAPTLLQGTAGDVAALALIAAVCLFLARAARADRVA